MIYLLILRDFFTKDVLGAARMLYEGGASSCGYYHTYKVEMDAYFSGGKCVFSETA